MVHEFILHDVIHFQDVLFIKFLIIIYLPQEEVRKSTLEKIQFMVCNYNEVFQIQQKFMYPHFDISGVNL